MHANQWISPPGGEALLLLSCVSLTCRLSSFVARASLVSGKSQTGGAQRWGAHGGCGLPHAPKNLYMDGRGITLAQPRAFTGISLDHSREAGTAIHLFLIPIFQVLISFRVFFLDFFSPWTIAGLLSTKPIWKNSLRKGSHATTGSQKDRPARQTTPRNRPKHNKSRKPRNDLYGGSSDWALR